MRRKLYLASTSLASLSCAMMASAQVSAGSYSYDIRGRLIAVVASGGQINAQTRSFCYDAVGNRVAYASNLLAGGVGCNAPAPAPNLVVQRL